VTGQPIIKIKPYFVIVKYYLMIIDNLLMLNDVSAKQTVLAEVNRRITEG